MKFCTFIAILLQAASICNAQEVLLDVNVNADTVPKKFGPNMKNYTYSFISYGLVLGKSDSTGMESRMWRSNEFIAGIRYKYKISNHVALGTSIYYGLINYHIVQDDKLFPEPSRYNKEKFIYNNFGGDAYLRLNFGKRGNRVGNFIDFGGYGDWGFSIKHYTLVEYPTAVNGIHFFETYRYGLDYTNPVNYGGLIRIGLNRFVFYGKYRLSNLFNTTVRYPELPRIIAGVEIGLFK